MNFLRSFLINARVLALALRTACGRFLILGAFFE